jgi:hypothetical protein
MKAFRLEEWNEDCGDVLWWSFPVVDSPYVGSPICYDWPGYHTHWTPLPPPPTLSETDIVQRLRITASETYPDRIKLKAANEIERLRMALKDAQKRLRSAGMLGADEKLEE